MYFKWVVWACSIFLTFLRTFREGSLKRIRHLIDSNLLTESLWHEASTSNRTRSRLTKLVEDVSRWNLKQSVTNIVKEEFYYNGLESKEPVLQASVVVIIWEKHKSWWKNQGSNAWSKTERRLMRRKRRYEI